MGCGGGGLCLASNQYYNMLPMGVGVLFPLPHYSPPPTGTYRYLPGIRTFRYSGYSPRTSWPRSFMLSIGVGPPAGARGCTGTAVPWGTL